MIMSVGKYDMEIDPFILHEKLMYGGFYKNEQREYVQILEKMVSPVVFDVGANIGFFSLLFANYAKEVHCFEPISFVYKKLRENTEEVDNIIPNKIALSDVEGVDKMFISKNHNQGSSLSTKFMKRNESNYDGTFEMVKLCTLDSYCLLRGIKQIDLLKIDVEGHELNVLKGASNLLEKKAIKNIIYESFGSLIVDVHELLESFAFNISSFEVGAPLYMNKAVLND